MLGHARSENVWDIAAILFYRYSHHKLHFELLPWETWGFRTRSHPLVKHRRSLQASERSKRPQATQALVKQTGVLLWSPAVHMWFPKIIHFNRIVHDKPVSGSPVYGNPHVWMFLKWCVCAGSELQPNCQLLRDGRSLHSNNSQGRKTAAMFMHQESNILGIAQCMYIYVCVCAYTSIIIYIYTIYAYISSRIYS